MADKPFVITDRRRFTTEGELRPDAPQPEPRASREEPAQAAPEAPKGPQPVPTPATDEPDNAELDALNGFGETEDQLPPAPTREQNEQAARAYAATVDRLDTAMRSMNPGGERVPEMSFERFIQSLYMQALLQLGGTGDPNQPAQVDILGARQTIDMVSIIAEKTAGNLSPDQDKLVQSAIFELRMGFLEITQALARQAATRQGTPGQPGMGSPMGMPPGPSIVR